jgi:hypothetical protein
MIDTPVLLLIYNRPQLTRRVFEEVRRQRPRQLFVVADGPRAARTGDDERCAAARAVIDGVDWPCTVEREFAERNLGCRARVASGLAWFFGRVERGIVLEDDCLPHPSFFSFCEALLDRHASDSRVMHIAGANFQNGRRWGDGSYYASSYPTVWGWASWRRAWRRYDLEMKAFPAFLRSGKLRARIPSIGDRAYWLGTFQMMHERRVDTWDHAWTFAIWNDDGVALVPNANLVSNIGFGGDATHTTRSNPGCFDIPAVDAGPIVPPSHLDVAAEADRETLRRFLGSYGRRALLRLYGHALRAELASRRPLAV